jgi:flagellar protein FliO/FliZ
VTLANLTPARTAGPTRTARPTRTAGPTHAIAGLLLAGGSGHALAQAAAETPSTFASSLQALAAMAVVIALIFGLAWLARRVTGGAAHGGLIKVRSAAAVGSRERVVIVEVENTWLVLGVASGQVNLLHSMPRGETQEAPGGAGAFVAKLAQARERHAP